jgi:glycosyltransferase involved in cell wall biosynthesis
VKKASVAQLGCRGIPNHRGGVERVIEAVAPRLVALGYQVTVHCANWSGFRAHWYKGVRLRYTYSIRSKYFDTFVRSFLATMKELFSSSNIVHYHGIGSAPLALLARLGGKKVVVTVHGLDWQRRKWNAFGEGFLRIGELASVRLPHETVVVGLELKRSLDRRYGTDVTYIPNGVEERRQREVKRIAEFGVGRRDYILFLARLVPEKQCHLLIEAFLGLPNRHGVKLIIAGAVWHSQSYVASLRELAGNDSSISFTGEVDEEVLEELYSNCYAYVLPSEVEGMSLSLLDAMAFGTCIVASDIPANAEVVGDSGLLFRTGSVADLRGKLEEILSDPERAETCRTAALQRMSTEFNWDKIVQQWDGLYARLLAPR